MAMGFETECHMVDGTPKLHPRTLDEVRFRMIHHYDETIIHDEPIGTKTLFGSVMKRIHQLSPDVIMFPAYSAVPLAAAVEGFYEAIDQTAPHRTYIHASRRLTTPTRYMDAEQVVQNEVDRLRREWAGSTAVVLDHYVCGGGSLRLATTLLERAGITELDGFPLVRWYGDIDDDEKDDMDLASMTYPRHDAFMRSVGRQAALYSSLCRSASPHK